MPNTGHRKGTKTRSKPAAKFNSREITSLRTAVTPSHDRPRRLDQDFAGDLCNSAIRVSQLGSFNDFGIRPRRKCEIETLRCHKTLTTLVKKVSLDLC